MRLQCWKLLWNAAQEPLQLEQSEAAVMHGSNRLLEQLSIAS